MAVEKWKERNAKEGESIPDCPSYKSKWSSPPLWSLHLDHRP